MKWRWTSTGWWGSRMSRSLRKHSRRWYSLRMEICVRLSTTSRPATTPPRVRLLLCRRRNQIGTSLACLWCPLDRCHQRYSPQRIEGRNRPRTKTSPRPDPRRSLSLRSGHKFLKDIGLHQREGAAQGKDILNDETGERAERTGIGRAVDRVAAGRIPMQVRLPWLIIGGELFAFSYQTRMYDESLFLLSTCYKLRPFWGLCCWINVFLPECLATIFWPSQQGFGMLSSLPIALPSWVVRKS